jgi:hypothetical protein
METKCLAQIFLVNARPCLAMAPAIVAFNDNGNFFAETLAQRFLPERGVVSCSVPIVRFRA